MTVGMHDPTESLGLAWLAACEEEKSITSVEVLVVPEGGIDAGFLSPRWPSPIPELDTATHGGIYGVAALGGDAGSGKSMFSASVALKTALRGERAIYVAAEMTKAQNLSRFGWLGAHWGYPAERVLECLGHSLVVLEPDQRLSFEDFAMHVGRWLMGQTDALVIVDSINSLLGHFTDPLGYWELFERLLGALIATRKRSEGRFCALVISELNQDGVSKGRRLEYAADLMLHMKQTATPRVVKLKVAKNRERGSDGPLGEFRMTALGTYERVGS